MANYSQFANFFGLSLLPRGDSSVYALNAANTRFAIPVISPVASTLNSVRLCFSGTGAIPAASVSCELRAAVKSSTKYQPDSSALETKTCATAPTTVGMYNFTGFTTALTANKLYYLVLRNTDASPGTKYPSISYAVYSTGLAPLDINFGANALWGLPRGMMYTTDGGTTWLNNFSSGTNYTGWRIGLSDGSYHGRPFTAATVNDGQIYSARESGIKLTSPANTAFYARGLALALSPSVTGTPTGVPRLRLYSGSSPSIEATASDVDGWYTNWAIGWFASPVLILPSTIYRIVMGESTQSDTSSNRFNVPTMTIDSDSDSTPLIPYSACYTYYDGSSWTDTATKVTGGGFLLDDSAGEFASGGASGPSRGKWLSRLQNGK